MEKEDLLTLTLSILLQFLTYVCMYLCFSDGLAVRNPPANARDAGLIPWVGKIRWRRKRQPTAVFWPGESHGQRSLVGFGPQSCEESDAAQQLNNPKHHVLTYKTVAT